MDILLYILLYLKLFVEIDIELYGYIYLVGVCRDVYL